MKKQTKQVRIFLVKRKGMDLKRILKYKLKRIPEHLRIDLEDYLNCFYLNVEISDPLNIRPLHEAFAKAIFDANKTLGTFDSTSKEIGCVCLGYVDCPHIEQTTFLWKRIYRTDDL